MLGIAQEELVGELGGVRGVRHPRDILSGGREADAGDLQATIEIVTGRVDVTEVAVIAHVPTVLAGDRGEPDVEREVAEAAVRPPRVVDQLERLELDVRLGDGDRGRRRAAAAGAAGQEHGQNRDRECGTSERSEERLRPPDSHIASSVLYPVHDLLSPLRVRRGRRRRTRTRRLLFATAIAALPFAGGPLLAAPPSIRPGGIVRWAVDDVTTCVMAGRRWAPLDGECWYPIDLATPVGRLEIGAGDGRRLSVREITVGAYPYTTERLTIPDEGRVVLSPRDESRAARESARIAELWRLETPTRFRLPLGDPLASMPAGGRFGARRILNGLPRSPHSGIDYPVAEGTPVRAVGDGTVVLADDLFFSGRSLFIDHGDGLISMYFHLSEITVVEGDDVHRGQRIGAVGATGRVTGPHLHFALRWHGARIDPQLLRDPNDVPHVSEPRPVSEPR